MIETVILGVVIAALIYYYTIKPLSYWKERGVKQGKPYWLFGDTFTFLFQIKSFADFQEDAYKKHSDSRYFGIYLLNEPVLMLKDPDLIKQLAITDFEHFTDHPELLPRNDPLWAKNLAFLKGQKWHDSRPIMSRNFTSSKMKSMFLLICECAENFIQFFDEQEEDIIEIEAKNIFSRYATDVMATATFGFKTNSLKEPDNDFYIKGTQTAILSSISSNLKIFSFLMFPKIYTMLDIPFFSEEVRKFYLDIIERNVKKREEKGITRMDLIHFLLQAKKGVANHEKQAEETGFATVTDYYIGKGVQTEITNMDITTQAFTFFGAGLDSTSTLMAFMSHELALHPDVQNKLRCEIQQTFEECKGKITYEALVKMKYLDMVVSETLRKWMSFAATDRICTKKYTIPPINPGERPVVLEPGMRVWIPIYSLHHDSKYYPEPHKFDPERFSDNNKSRDKPYYPFGVGPRNCIGSRFAILKTKIIFFHLLLNFEIVITSKTRIPAVRTKTGLFGTHAEGGLHLAFKNIQNNNKILKI